MVSLIELAIPNLAPSIIGGVIIVITALVGVLLLVYFPLLRAEGLFVILAGSALGLTVIFGLSFLQDIFSDANATLALVLGVVALIYGYFLFGGKDKMNKTQKRKRR